MRDTYAPAVMAFGATLRRYIVMVPGIFLILAVLIIVFSIATPAFATLPNLRNVLIQSMVLLVVSMPMTLIIMSEGIDISAGGVLSLAGVMMGIVVLGGGGIVLGLLTAMTTATLAGALNGALISFVRIPPFVVTLGSLGIAQGVALTVTDGGVIVGMGPELQRYYNLAPLGIPMPIVIGACAFLLTHFVLYHTRFGRYVVAIGGNRDALVLAGIRANWYHFGIYAFAGFYIGIAAFLLTARTNSAHPTIAVGTEFDAISAVIVGGTAFRRGEGWILGTLFGVIAIGVVRNGLNLLAVRSPVQIVCIGVLVIAALLFDRLKGRV